jgi:hypothetical protein
MRVRLMLSMAACGVCNPKVSISLCHFHFHWHFEAFDIHNIRNVLFWSTSLRRQWLHCVVDTILGAYRLAVLVDADTVVQSKHVVWCEFVPVNALDSPKTSQVIHEFARVLGECLRGLGSALGRFRGLWGALKGPKKPTWAPSMSLYSLWWTP